MATTRSWVMVAVLHSFILSSRPWRPRQSKYTFVRGTLWRTTGDRSYVGEHATKHKKGFAIEFHEKIVSQTLAVRTQVSYDRELCMDTDEMVRKI